MPNYRYTTPEYMRRTNNYGRSSSSQTPPCSSVPVAPCCEKRTEYDALSDLPLAMAYVPWQEWRSLYEAEKGFRCGTIFTELDLAFQGKGGCSK